jgi:hypothetical protein
MKTILKYASIMLVLSIVGLSCKKSFVDINENQNSPTDLSITPNLLLPRSLQAVAARMATSYGAVGQWMGYWSRGGDFGPNGEAESYNITTTFEADEFAGWYDILFDVHTMQNKAKVLNQPFYQGVAKILKAQGFMYLVDQYNNVPYTKAFDLVNNVTPTYDKGSDIYLDLNKQLNEAVALINSAVIDNDIKAADIMFAGNKVNWVKYANTLHLKLLLRQAYIPGFDPSSEMLLINANGAGYLTTTASVNPNYLADNNKQNPFWNAYKLTYTGTEADKFNRANNFALNIMRGSNDIRYQYFYSAAQTPLSGNTYYGYNYGEALPSTGPYFSANSSNVAGPGLAKSATQSQWVLTATESLFLQAEAAQRTWITTSTAASLFTAAINESFNWLGCPAGSAATYLGGGSPYVDFAGSTDKIKTIVTQKYLSLNGVNNFEAWVDFRRIPGIQGSTTVATQPIPNVPFSLNANRNGRHVPNRLQYPQQEYAYNAAAVGAQGTIDPQTSKIFWDIN